MHFNGSQETFKFGENVCVPCFTLIPRYLLPTLDKTMSRDHHYELDILEDTGASWNASEKLKLIEYLSSPR